MHSVYHDKMDGNGDLDPLMKEINELPLKTDWETLFEFLFFFILFLNSIKENFDFFKKLWYNIYVKKNELKWNK